MLNVKLFFLLVLGNLAYDIGQSGSFQKSQTYKYLNDIGALQFGKKAFDEIKKLLSNAYNWIEKNIPVYYNKTCIIAKPYIELFYDLLLVIKSNAMSLTYHFFLNVNKNFPTLQNSVNVISADSVIIAKESLEILFNHFQNYTVKAINYANNILGSQKIKTT